MVMWVVFAVFTVLVILSGLGLVWLARRTLGGVFLGLAVFFYGMVFLFLTLPRLVAIDPAFTNLSSLLVLIVHAATSVAFSIVYPRIVLNRGHKVALGLTGVVATVLVALVLMDPQSYFQDGEVTTRWFVMFFVTSSLSFLLVLIVLGLRWLTSAPGARRTQIAWGLIPFIFVNLHDGLGFAVYPYLFHPGVDFEWSWIVTIPSFGMVFVTSSLALLAGLALVGIALTRVIKGNPTLDERALAYVTLYLLPLTLLQVVDESRTGIYHYYVDYLFVFLILYAVARFNMVDLDLKLKWTMNRGTVAAAFIAVFFVVSELSKLFIEGLVGNAIIGVLGASTLVFAIAPLQSVAQRLSDRAMPHVQDSPGYRDQRSATIYQAQVESLASDGHISIKERSALLRLQKDLGLEPGHANQIEAQVMEAILARA